MQPRFEFTLHATDGKARTGTIRMRRGEIRTPAFMPVGTAATVKAMKPESVRATGADILLGNTYHLMLRPGADVVADLGGLHRFEDWSGHMLTDSGGFQIFSLNPKVDDDGATFKSTYDGSTHRVTPEDAVAYAARILQDQLQLFVHFEDALAAPTPVASSITWCTPSSSPVVSVSSHSRSAAGGETAPSVQSGCCSAPARVEGIESSRCAGSCAATRAPTLPSWSVGAKRSGAIASTPSSASFVSRRRIASTRWRSRSLKSSTHSRCSCASSAARYSAARGRTGPKRRATRRRGANGSSGSSAAAGADETRELTGMEIGGVTPVGLGADAFTVKGATVEVAATTAVDGVVGLARAGQQGAGAVQGGALARARPDPDGRPICCQGWLTPAPTSWRSPAGNA